MAPAGVLAAAVVVDAVVASAGVGAAAAPVVTLAAVAGIGLARGLRAGAFAGFAVGIVLDLLSGPAGLGGAETLTGVLVGACAGCAPSRAVPRHLRSALVGAALVPLGAIVGLSVHGLAGWAPAVARSVVGSATAAGMVVTPLVRQWSENLPVRPVPNPPARA